MNINNSLKKFSFFDYSVIFIFIFYAGGASTFARSYETWENLYSVAFILIITIILYFKKRVKISKNLISLIFGFLMYSLILTAKFKEIHPRFILNSLSSFFIAYTLIYSYRISFFIIFKRIIYFLAIISLFFWVFYQIIPSTLTEIMNSLNFFEYGDLNIESNLIVYTINSSNISEMSSVFIAGYSIFRNAGFAWEPGVFAVFLSLAIFINLLQFKRYYNRELLILVLALITTFSTTGYAILIIFLLLIVTQMNIKNKIFIFPIAILFCLYLTTLSFMSDKVTYAANQNTEKMVKDSVLYGFSYAPQRITSFLIDLQDFFNNPIVGYGGHQAEKWTVKLGAKISSVSGMGKLLAKYGIVGTIFFFYFLIRSSKLFSELFKIKGKYWMFYFFLPIIFSFSLFENPILICFWLLSLLVNKQTDTQKKIFLVNN